MIAFREHTRHLDKEKQYTKLPKTILTSDTGTSSDRDEENDKKTEEEAESETCRLLENYKEITLYPDGAPEEIAQKRVEKLFENWSKEDHWHYLDVYEEFAGMYPRVTSGKPWVPWVSDAKIKGNVLKKPPKRRWSF